MHTDDTKVVDIQHILPKIACLWPRRDLRRGSRACSLQLAITIKISSENPIQAVNLGAKTDTFNQYY